MSQRLCTTPRDLVRTGGDRPLQSLFLVVTARYTGALGRRDGHGLVSKT